MEEDGRENKMFILTNLKHLPFQNLYITYYYFNIYKFKNTILDVIFKKRINTILERMFTV